LYRYNKARLMEQIGRYRIERELGRGAMGVVYCARDTAIGRTVAIKTIRLTDLASPAEQARLRDRLFREAQSAGILSHPNIVTIYDVAEENGIAYVAMEYVNGQTLDRIVATSSPGGAFVLEVLGQTAAALDYAHKRGIVHRDIKPANIIVDEGPLAKISDFGVAKIQSQEMTQAGLMVGTPNYMSPEQIRGMRVDGKSDQFSLAVIAYQLMTGEKPFAADSIAALAFKIVNEQPPPAQQLNPTLDWPVDTVLRRGLAKQPEDRYPSCSDFVFALENACRSCKTWKPLVPGAVQSIATVVDRTAAAPVVLPSLPVDTEPDAEPAADPGAVPVPLRWTRIVATVMFAGALVAAAVMGAFQYFDTEAPPPAVSSEEAQAPQAAAVKKPTAMPVLPGDSGDPPAAEAAEAEPAAAPEQPRTAPVKPSTTAPLGPTRLVTNPPGAYVVVDGTSGLSCTTPCSLDLGRGRHTLAATMNGYRRALKIFETPADSEVFINLEQSLGTVVVRSEPRGATIVVDGRSRSEKTPAILNLPSGQHTIEIVRDGERESHEVTVRESAITNVQVTFRQ
jgi:tRNA A-37 threonylcarbamoyl transferase component Bud32